MRYIIAIRSQSNISAVSHPNFPTWLQSFMAQMIKFSLSNRNRELCPGAEVSHPCHSGAAGGYCEGGVVAMCREDANECTGKGCRLYLVIGGMAVIYFCFIGLKIKVEMKSNLFSKYML